MTADDFLAALRASEIFSEADFRVLTNAAPAEARAGAEALANWFVKSGALTAFQTKRILAGRGRGLVREPYELCGMLGRGGMGAVYLAWDRARERFAAIKMLSEEQRTLERGQLRFQREIEVNRRLEHPRVAKGLEAGVWKKTPFLAMEYVPGPTLFQLVTRHGKPDLAWTCLWTSDVADALDYIHQMGVVHRDMKPSNVIVTPDGAAKVLDLGLARLFDDDHNEDTVTGEKRMVGSFDYMAPEQTKNAARADARADIYSLGCVLYFVLTGRPPFHHRIERKAKIDGHRRVPVEPVTVRRPDCPVGLAKAIAKMLAKNPHERYSVAAEVRDVLRDWADRLTGGEPPSDLPAEWFADVPAPPRRPSSQTSETRTGFWRRLGVTFRKMVERKDRER